MGFGLIRKTGEAGMKEQITAEQLSNWEQARSLATETALETWEAIKSFYHATYEIFEKPDGPATEADRLADRLIVEKLSAGWSGEAFGFLTEESEDDPARLDKKQVWIIDPIDGTKSFISRDGNFAIHIAMTQTLEDVHRPVASVVYCPEHHTLYSAVRTRGASIQTVETDADGAPHLGDAQPLTISPRQHLHEFRSVVSNSNRTSRLMRLIETLPLESYRHVGSLGVKVCDIAAGRAELYVNISRGMTKEWDLCAPELILTEAGGTMTDLEGKVLQYNQPDPQNWHGLLATNGTNHESLLGHINEFLEAEGHPPAPVTT